MIHSGIYYPPDSLKTALCIRGRDLLYSRCKDQGIPFRQTGKLVLALSKDQEKYLEKLFERSKKLKRDGIGDVPLEWMNGDQVRELEPDVGENVVSALRSPKTGIVDSHSLMENLEKGAFEPKFDPLRLLLNSTTLLMTEITDSETGELVYGTRVVRIDRHELSGGGKRGDGTENGWVVQTVTDDGSGGDGERTAVLAKSVINAAGLK